MTTSAERRERILRAAQKLFCHYGTHKTTIGDIAREVGIGVGSVYLEFCSKDDIVNELAVERERRVLGAMRTAAARGNAADRLARALEARVHALFEVAAEGAHSCDLVGCRTARKSGTTFNTDELRIVQDVLAFGIDAGEFGRAEPADLANLIAEAFAGLSPPGIFERSREESLHLTRLLSRLLVSGIASRLPQAPTGRRSRGSSRH